MEERLKIVFVLPHPDDEALAFGLPAQLVEMGHSVSLIALTKGDLGSHTSSSRRDTAKKRKQEFLNAGTILGVENTKILGFADGDLEFNIKKARIKLLKELRKIKADIVISTDSNDYHEDHGAAHDIAWSAAFHMQSKPFLGRRFPPVPSAIFYSMDTQGSQLPKNTIQDGGENGIENLHSVNLIVGVSENAIQKSINAFKAHKTQLENSSTDYVDLAAKGSRRRGRQAGFEYGVGLLFEPFGGYRFAPENKLAKIFGKNSISL